MTDNERPEIAIDDVVRMCLEKLEDKDTNKEWLEKNCISEETIIFLASTFYTQTLDEILRGKSASASIMDALCCMFQVGWDMSTQFGPVKSHIGGDI